MKKFYICYLFLIVLSSAVAQADTVYLKEGGSVQGTILQKNGNDVIISVNGVPQKYFAEQVANIVKDEALPANFNINAADFPNISTNKVALILQLIEANGTHSVLKKSFDQMMVSMPAEKQAEFQQIFNIDEIVKRLVPIFDQNYTEDDLNGLVQFYQSPLGQKLLNVTPEIMKQTMQEMMNYFKEKATAVPAAP